MSKVLELPQINLHGTAKSSAEAIDEAGRILVATGAVTDGTPMAAWRSW